ncbi:MAG: DNA polymerase I [Gemmatimonadota bacterium]|nr:DNA polymerase I [Gemmatimonadota bacterium]
MERRLAGQLFLIDGYAMLYRAHFAFIKNPRTTSRGEVTSAVFGMVLSLKKIFDECRPDYLAMVLDSRGPTFRHERYPEYKATREKMPEELKTQIPWATELLEEAFRIPVFMIEGYEADDVIGSLARRAGEQGLEAVIVSGDKDFYQLINERVKLYNPRGRSGEAEWVDLSNASERLGVPPEQVIDLLSLMGDSSDNVPGVRGIGKVGAVRLLGDYQSLEDIYDHLEQVAPDGVRKKLEEGRESAFLSRELVTIHTGLDCRIDLDTMRLKEPDEPKLLEMFERLEFRTLIERFGISRSEPEEEVTKDYRLVDSLEMLEEVSSRIRRAGCFAVDVETTSLDPMSAALVGISLAYKPHQAFYVPVGHANTRANLPLDKVLGLLRPLLESEAIGTVGQNIKYDMIVLERHGAKVKNIVDDPMLASYLLDPGRRSHGLDFLAESILGHKMIKYEDVTGKGRQQVLFDQVSVLEASAYSGEDADITLLVAGKLGSQLIQDAALEKLYREVELPLISVLARMEMAGVALNVPYLEQISSRMGEKLVFLKARVFELAGHEFNVNSTQQLAHVLFEELGIKPRKKTKTGFSTDSTVLAELAAEHELPEVILEHRELAKLKSTYVDALPRQVNPVTGRVHTSFNQVVTATGRLSSSNPNLQNIPIRTEEGRTIRRAFVPGSEGKVLLCADYSQIELRMLAHLSGDESMIEAFIEGVDIHLQTASRLFGFAPEQVSPELRGRAKTINFGVLYGMGAHRLSRELKIPYREARGFIEDYFNRFPRVREYIDTVVARTREQGWVSTILGRCRKLPQIDSANRRLRENAERMALNTPIQGSAADLIKVAMLAVDKRLTSKFPEVKMILQVHDELVFEVPESQAGKVGEEVRGLMEQAMELKVPIKVDIGVGPNWLESK